MNENRFMFKGQTLVAVPFTTCGECYFHGMNCPLIGQKDERPSCLLQRRKDGRETMFVLGKRQPRRRICVCTIKTYNRRWLFMATFFGDTWGSSKVDYATKRSAVRGAKRFCAAIGHECVIKENQCETDF